jgi:hypothetical protein
MRIASQARRGSRNAAGKYLRKLSSKSLAGGWDVATP